MAKVSFSKLNQIKKLPSIVEMLGDQAIEIEQYLPLADKMDLITAVIEQSGNGEEGFFNIVKLEAYFRIEVVQAYTNISFTEKQLSDTTKLYDALELNGVWDFVESHIPEEELDYIWESIVALAKEVTDYNNSVLGILKTIVQMNAFTEHTKTEINELQKQAEQLKNSPLIQEILPLLNKND